MNRFNRRVSRLLIAVLVLAVALGAFSIYHNRKPASGAVAGNESSASGRPSSTAQNDGGQSTAAAQNPTPAGPAIPSHVQLAADENHATPTVTNNLSGSISPGTSNSGNANNTGNATHTGIAMNIQPDRSAGAVNLTATTEPSGGVLADAKAKMDAGDLVAARAELNDSLKSGALDPAQTAADKTLMSQINQTLVFSRHRYANDPYEAAYVVKPGDALRKIAPAYDCTWQMIARINGINERQLRSGATIKVLNGPFFLLVTKSKYTVDVYLGGLPGDKASMYVTTYPVGLGRNDSTPPGTWAVEAGAKLKHPKYYPPEGGTPIEAADPKNPLGGYWIGLTGIEGQAVDKRSYGLHGTIEPDSIGRQSSMGCIRMNSQDIPIVFDMMTEGKSLVKVVP